MPSIFSLVPLDLTSEVPSDRHWRPGECLLFLRARVNRVELGIGHPEMVILKVPSDVPDLDSPAPY